MPSFDAVYYTGCKVGIGNGILQLERLPPESVFKSSDRLLEITAQYVGLGLDREETSKPLG